jgi:hypothetical protein
MLDRSTFWPAPGLTVLTGEGLAVTLLPPVPQLMVSGDLPVFCRAHGLPAPVGLLAEVTLPRHALRLARNRMLVVGDEVDNAAAGWIDGAAVTPMTGALGVVEIAGSNRMQVFARASAIDPRGQSPSAALQFAGVTAALCQTADALRLHLDRGLVAYLMDWIAATGLAR